MKTSKTFQKKHASRKVLSFFLKKISFRKEQVEHQKLKVVQKI